MKLLVVIILISLGIISCKEGFKFQTHSGSKHRSRHHSKKYLVKYANQAGMLTKAKKSKIQTYSQIIPMPERTLQTIAYGLNLTAVSETVDMTAAITAVPAEVDDELNKRIALTDEEIINNRFENTWDIRTSDFNCKSDSLTGKFYMIDKVADFSKEAKEEFFGIASSANNIRSMVSLAQVNVQANEEKLAIYDMNNALKDIIYFQNVYPRDDELKIKMSKAKVGAKGRRELMEETKMKVVNASQLTGDANMTFTGLYCTTLINEPKEETSLESLYQSYMAKFDRTPVISEQNQDNNDKNPFVYMMKQLRDKDKEYGTLNQKNIHNNAYYDLLTLCHQDYAMLDKMTMFFNREKYDCVYEYNAENMGIKVRSSVSVVQSEATSSYQELQLKRQIEQEQAEQERLEELKKKQEQDTIKTEQQLNQEELERLQAELSELTQTMDQEQQYSENEINGIVNSVQGMQESLSSKNDQLKCLEKALEIKQEEENEQVIRLLKDEEMNKIRSVVKSARSKMSDSYKKRIETLKKNLEEQKSKISREKESFDQVMVNLIKTGMKSGSTANCVPTDAQMKEKIQLETFIEGACTKVLDDQETAFELQGGTLDLINKCTKKEQFCGICCQYEFGAEKLVERNNCDFECSSKFRELLNDKDSYSADLTGVIQRSAYDEISKKVSSEQEKQKELNRLKQEAASKTEAAVRFKQSVKNSRRRRK